MMSLSARWKRRGEKGDPFGWRCAELSHPCSSESGPKTKEGESLLLFCLHLSSLALSLSMLLSLSLSHSIYFFPPVPILSSRTIALPLLLFLSSSLLLLFSQQSPAISCPAAQPSSTVLPPPSHACQTLSTYDALPSIPNPKS